MPYKLSFSLISIIIGSIGAITGIISFVWHIINSRSKIILDRVSFTRDDKRDRTKTEAITCWFSIRNKGNRSTTIENIVLLFGNRVFDTTDFVRRRHVEPNSSWSCEIFKDFSAKEFEDILKDKKVKLGVEVIHTFGRLKRVGYTDFKSDWLNI